MWLEGIDHDCKRARRYAVRQYEFLGNPAQSVGGTPKTKTQCSRVGAPCPSFQRARKSMQRLPWSAIGVTTITFFGTCFP